MDSESTNLYLKNVLQRDHLKCQGVFHTETTIHEKAVSQEGYGYVYYVRYEKEKNNCMVRHCTFKTDT